MAGRGAGRFTTLDSCPALGVPTERNPVAICNKKTGIYPRGLLLSCLETFPPQDLTASHPHSTSSSAASRAASNSSPAFQEGIASVWASQ